MEGPVQMATGLTLVQQQQAAQLVKQFGTVFSDHLGKGQWVEYQIETLPGKIIQEDWQCIPGPAPGGCTQGNHPDADGWSSEGVQKHLVKPHYHDP